MTKTMDDHVERFRKNVLLKIVENFDEVLESFFTITMNSYKQLGLPQINFILSPKKRIRIENYSDEAPLMSSQYKFFRLSRMINGRIRKMKAK